MKLRIRGNSLRFRLTQEEVKQLEGGGSVVESLRLGPLPQQQLTYSLHSRVDAQAIALEYRSGTLGVFLPSQMCEGWMDSDQVGFRGEIPVEGGEPVTVLVEKDFACLTPRDPVEDAGAFPNPGDSC